MKAFLLALALTFAIIGGTVVISPSTSTPSHADCTTGSPC